MVVLNYRSLEEKRVAMWRSGSALRYSELCYELNMRSEDIEDMDLLEDGRGEKYEKEQERILRLLDPENAVTNMPKSYGGLKARIREICDAKCTSVPKLGGVKMEGLCDFYFELLGAENPAKYFRQVKADDSEPNNRRRKSKSRRRRRRRS